MKKIPKKLQITKMVLETADKKRAIVKKEIEKIKKQDVYKPIAPISKVKTEAKQEVNKPKNFKEKALALWNKTKGFLSSLLKILP